MPCSVISDARSAIPPGCPWWSPAVRAGGKNPAQVHLGQVSAGAAAGDDAADGRPADGLDDDLDPLRQPRARLNRQRRTARPPVTAQGPGACSGRGGFDRRADDVRDFLRVGLHDQVRGIDLRHGRARTLVAEALDVGVDAVVGGRDRTP